MIMYLFLFPLWKKFLELYQLRLMECLNEGEYFERLPPDATTLPIYPKNLDKMINEYNFLFTIKNYLSMLIKA